MGIGDWGLGPIPNPQSPIPNPQSPKLILYRYSYNLNHHIRNNFIYKLSITNIILLLHKLKYNYKYHIIFINISYLKKNTLTVKSGILLGFLIFQILLAYSTIFSEAP